jgi:predicted dehydrogenase
LQALGFQDIVGVDVREDRRQEAQTSYGIQVHSDYADTMQQQAFGGVVISLPPLLHVAAMQACLNHNTPFFVEASVVDDGLADIISAVKEQGLLAAPSSTLHFHPAIACIRDIVSSGALGTLSNVILHSGQYLPDWHTYEKVSDYYVSKPATGGAREIVPFEMTWFTEVFGFPQDVSCHFRKTIHIEGAEGIADTYNAVLDYGSFLASVTVDVVSRQATRRLLINGSKQQLVWNWEDAAVKVFDGATATWTHIPYDSGTSAVGYNKNIGENMYIDEIRAFVDAIEGKATFPNNLDNDHAVLKLLYRLESTDPVGIKQVMSP